MPDTRRINPKAKGILEKPHRAMFTDIAVVGAGLSGLSAALSAAGQGAEVILIDKLEHLGGNNKDLLEEELHDLEDNFFGENNIDGIDINSSQAAVGITNNIFYGFTGTAIKTSYDLNEVSISFNDFYQNASIS